ncbi:hypothetical protein SESBI_37264 [Sesbania bispinosa]|nr:hypothetical protein SESBI_37264 [Sesbania bispinosa]
MSNRIVLRSTASSTNRRQPLLKSQSSKTGSRVGEVIGGTAAVCCCCPCGIANFLVLAIYKVPAGLCRQMLRKRRRQRMIKEGLFPPKRHNCSCGCCDDVNGPRIYPLCANDASDIKKLHSQEPDMEALALEKEMWDRFYSTGFWRSSSRRESSNQTLPNYPQPQPQFQFAP